MGLFWDLYQQSQITKAAEKSGRLKPASYRSKMKSGEPKKYSTKSLGGLRSTLAKTSTPMAASDNSASRRTRNEAPMIQGNIGIAIGLVFLLIGLGKARVSKNPQANAAFVEKWGKFFLISGPTIALVGVVMIFEAL